MKSSLPISFVLDAESWNVTTGPEENVSFGDDGCTVDSTSSKKHSFIVPKPETNISMPYQIEATIRFLPGSNKTRLGIQWDRKSAATKRFSVRADGFWQLYKYQSGWELLQNFTKTKLLPDQPNSEIEIAVTVLPYTAVFSVNGQEITRFQVQSHVPKPKPFGLTVADGKVVISNVRISDVSDEKITELEAALQAERLEALKKLDQLIGMDDIKHQIKTMANVIRVQQRRESLGLETQRPSNHMVISGPPGTGKTTVARILGEIMKSLGVISKGHVVETDRGGLVGKFIGGTAPKVKAKVKEAMGGILFIDEAYMLKPEFASGKDYGQEAIDTLMKQMEDNRDDLVVIIAGYKTKLEHFLNSNPGVTSRFKHHFDLRGYTAVELSEMFKMKIKANGYTVTDDTMKMVEQHLTHAVKTKPKLSAMGAMCEIL